MHRIAATPGGWTPDTDGVIFIAQTPAPIIILTSADTEIQTLAAALPHLPADFPAVRAVNLLQLQQPLSIDDYADQVLSSARVMVLRLLGGRSYWSYGLEVVKEVAAKTGALLCVLPGDDRPDPELISQSTASLGVVNQLWNYWIEGGIENIAHSLRWVSNHGLGTTYATKPPQPVPRLGALTQPSPTGAGLELPAPGGEGPGMRVSGTVGILFYRAHYLAGNTAPIQSLCDALQAKGITPRPVFISSLQDQELQAELLTALAGIDVLINTTSFSLAKLGQEQQPKLWGDLNVPIIQAILSGGTEAQWEAGAQGLSPRDVAMNVALPEVDGRIIGRAISFKSVATRHEQLETDVVVYQPRRDRITFITDLAAQWVNLRRKSKRDRRVALILANYPNRDGRLANGVGLDTPASCIEILNALQNEGYSVGNIPATGDDLIRQLTASVTNDPESWGVRRVHQSLPVADYRAYFATLPEAVQQGVIARWGEFDGKSIQVAGLQLGNSFIGIQPSRGYDRDPSLNYHAPDLEPTHDYLGYYYWVRSQFGADAIVHVGKHGNLEWLPGKSLALSNHCYPEVALGAIPNFYPFIVNDPGEGSQAKRRSQAVILDHLTPPLTRAELYGPLQQIEALIDEYYEAQTLDPSRLNLIGDRITAAVQACNFNQDLGIDSVDRQSLAAFLTRADGYLCELKEAQIRDGLHIFGQVPTGRQWRDLVIAIARAPGFHRLGLTRAIAADLGYDPDLLNEDYSTAISTPESPQKTVGDLVEYLEETAIQLIETQVMPTLTQLSPAGEGFRLPSPVGEGLGMRVLGPATTTELHWITTTLIPNLAQTRHEITQLLRGLNGEYIPAGPSGAPTRGRPEVLPTGRNFYSVDIRAIPTETAWSVGRVAAERVIERYTQEEGDYPRRLALSVWGTSTMRTGGDDVAQALALLGVQPIWDGLARRVVDFEVIPLGVLGRPRVDVMVRISGFFRDGFPNLIDLLDRAITTVAQLDEPADQNPLAAQVECDRTQWQAAGLPPDQAQTRAQYRIFGSKPGAYGAGLQGLIEAQNWTSDADLARAYMNWSSYAYTGSGRGHAAPEAFERRLSDRQIVLHNQDNREHDLLDSDDYYQFQGGLTAAVRHVSGQQPITYFGDNSQPQNPKVRHLNEEITRVYRSRVVNPKWIAGVMRHGYKGAFELAATVDYLFAYDATAHCVEDFMYQGVAEAYVLDEAVRSFIEAKNPWALRDMTERLLEAHQRGLWQQVDPALLDQLRTIVHAAEAQVEQTLTASD
ncbi:cobaltochelatase subunit CobN [Spirulina major]|uniref:cobaltochelatase subunit CobN n=1 Tax=Spirulina major TaxID=270636 RepID=UPI00093245DD|nr:cobaltochelatase subunit CobN [Spirulina major]